MTAQASSGDLPPIAFPPALLTRWPHLPAFWPDRAVAPPGPGALLVTEATPDSAPHSAALRFTLSPFAPPRFAGRDAPPLIITEEEGALAPGEAAALAALIARARLGGPPGLPDPGAAALGLPAGAALVLDPCDPARRGAAEAALAAARASGRPVILARDPFAGHEAPPVLAAVPGLRQVPRPLSPWTLLDSAAALYGATPHMAALAEAAGVTHDLAGEQLSPLL
ncbi:MAG TPA: hypothetical protein VIL69_10040, partial [Roseomonas sp.]